MGPPLSGVSQTRVDDRVIGCFDSCMNPLTFQECIIGCAAGSDAAGDVQTITANAGNADPGGGRNGVAAALADWCASAPNPPTKCPEQCFNNAICESRCPYTSD